MSFPNTRSQQPAKDAVDIEVPDAPNDSISSLAFSSAGEFLAAGSWNNEVRIYEVNPGDGRAQARAMYRHQGPVLDVCWNKEGNKVLSGGVDNVARMYDLVSGQTSQVAQHDAPLKNIRWIESGQNGILATVVATAERHIQTFSLTNPTVPFKTEMSPLRLQTRVVTCFPSANGFAVGSVEGRAAMHYAEESKSKDSYTFICHRKERTVGLKAQNDVYAINDIKFHPVHGTLSTAGSDGVINIWDKDAQGRTKTFDAAPGPISTTAFNRTGSVFAYAVSYDWSRGYSGMTHPNKIMLHACKEDEVKKRPLRK
ncbi:GLE2_2 [Sanghuangporus weigelae]